mgnify:CR=1 FL=1
MRFIDLLVMCLKNLTRRKLRSMLTLLGIILGSLSVSITLAIGSAIKSNNQKVLDSKGDLKIIEVSVNDMLNNTKKNKDKIYMDDKAIYSLKNMDGVDGVWAELEIPRDIIIFAGKNNRYKFYNLKGVWMDDIGKFGYELLNGKLPTQKTLEDKKYVQILAGQYFEYGFRNNNVKNWAKASRADNSPVEEYERKKYNYGEDDFVLKKPFVEYGKDDMVLGIELPKSNSNDDVELLDVVTMKSDTYTEKNNKTKYYTYNLNVTGRLNWVKVRDVDDWAKIRYASEGVFIDVDLAKELIKKYRKLNHITSTSNSLNSTAPLFTYNNVKIKTKDISYVKDVSAKVNKMGFSPQNKIEEVEKEQTRTRSNQLVLGVLGAITLFVASLSVANTMVTSMYERTIEIGVMKVIGCKVGNVQLLFLLESAILGLVGGTIGMALTYWISRFMNNITNTANPEDLTGMAQLLSTYMSMMKYDSYSTVKLDIALVAPKLWLYVILGSVVVAIVAGYLPSRKAAKISALTAIKDE